MANEAKQVMDTAARKAALDMVRRQMPEMVEGAQMIASIRRIHYDASIKQGFTPEQALALCMKPSLT